MTTTPFENLDRPLWGAEPIGREACVFDEDGKVDLRKTFYLLETGLLDASKVGRQWVSTPRRIRRTFSGECAELTPEQKARAEKAKRKRASAAV